VVLDSRAVEMLDGSALRGGVHQSSRPIKQRNKQ
jgi:hypothetical protein